MTPLNPQRLFAFLEDDPVFQRSQLAKEVSAQLLEELRDSLCDDVCGTVRGEVRELLPTLVVESLASEIRQLVRQSFGEELRALREEFGEGPDPADWWKGDEE
jgi:hypothetical protein